MVSLSFRLVAVIIGLGFPLSLCRGRKRLDREWLISIYIVAQVVPGIEIAHFRLYPGRHAGRFLGCARRESSQHEAQWYASSAIYIGL